MHSSNSEFAKATGIDISTLSRHVNEKVGITGAMLNRYEAFGVDSLYVQTGSRRLANANQLPRREEAKKIDVVYDHSQQESRVGEKKISIPFYLHPVSAGSAVPIASETPASYEVPAARVRQGAAFAVRASGESMVSVGIVPDSVLICERVNCDAEELIGRLVIASNGWGTVVKILARGEGGRLVLRSANAYRPDDYPDLEIDDEVNIQGVVLYVETDHRQHR